jgi:putative tricarboxylic transport membrane protein
LRSDATRVCVLALAALLAASAALAQPAAQPAFEQLRIIAPAAPGGGWDQTARAMQQVLERAGIVRTAVVENVPGAAGTIGLARFIGAERGEGNALLVSGLIMLGGIVTHRSPVTLADVDPIARLTGEYEVLTVPAASPFLSLDDLLRAFKARPESISWGGGSAGGSDQILAGLIAKAVGVEPRRVNYIAFSGGGESLSAILGGQVSVGINGLAEFAPQIEAGTVRVLAISSAERVPGVDAKTLREQGVDVEFENWRSVVAPPNLDAEQRQALEDAVAAMVRSAEWREMLERYRWLDRYSAGDEFARFSAAEEARVRDILADLGTGDAAATSLTAAGPYPLFVLGGLALFGVLAASSRQPKMRNAAAPPERRHKWRALALLGAAAAADLLLVERAGFLIASAVLFWLVARAFDERHPLRDGACALAVSAAAYFLFANVLELPLPAGVLAGWL